MGLDINTPKGQKTLTDEGYMLEYVGSKWKKYNLVQTEKTEASDCDGMILKNNTIVGLFESKCRNMTHDELISHGSWLITYDKLEKCRKLSESLKVKFIGLLYLIPSNIVLYWTIADKGEYCFDFNVSNTQTQRTVNGGQIIRQNAYLPIKYSKRI